MKVYKWDEIEAIFSRQAVLKGSFDKYAEASRGRHGTAEVDDAFLAEIDALVYELYGLTPEGSGLKSLP